MNSNKASHAPRSETLDVLIDRIEPLQTSDVQLGSSIDLVILNRSSIDIEFVPTYPLALRVDAAPALKISEPAPPPAPAPVAKVQLRFNAEAMFQSAREQLDQGKFGDAKQTLEELVKAIPNVSEYVATLALARFFAAADRDARFAETTRLAEHAKAYPYDVHSRAMMGRLFMELDRPHAAARYYKEALDLEPQRSDILAGLRNANAAIKPQNGSEKSAERLPSASFVPLAIMSFAAVALGLYVAGVFLGFGKNEAWLEPTDLFFWSRQAIFLLVGGTGAYLFARKQRIELEEVAVAPAPLFAGLALGLVAGALLPLAISRTSIEVLCLMAAAQVIAEEAFFRLFLGRVLARGLVGSLVPIVVSAALYAAYQLTFVDVTGDAMFSRVLLGGAAGALYATLHHKTESMTAAVVAHVAAAMAMIFASAF